MSVICKKCDIGFKLFDKVKEKYLEDGLCGKCRSRKEYIENIDKYRKTNTCPECGKAILKESKFCSSCSQLEERNHNFIDGHASKTRTCAECGGEISSGSMTGICFKCYAKTLSGEGNPNYRYGHYLREFYSSSKYKHWKLSVFERDKRICQVCKKQDERHTYQAHHIYPKRDYPDLVFSVENGITLCKTCHESISKNEYEYVDFFTNLIGPNKNSVNSVNAEMPIPNQVI